MLLLLAVNITHRDAHTDTERYICVYALVFSHNVHPMVYCLAPRYCLHLNVFPLYSYHLLMILYFHEGTETRKGSFSGFHLSGPISPQTSVEPWLWASLESSKTRLFWRDFERRRSSCIAAVKESLLNTTPWAQLLGTLYFGGLTFLLNYSALGESKILINLKSEYLRK